MSLPPNLDRLIEDLTATMGLLDDHAARQRPMHPSAPALEALGAPFITSDQLDVRAIRLRSRPWELQPIVSRARMPLLSGRVHLNYVLVGIAYARHDLRTDFLDGLNWNWIAILEWLVLRGIAGHQLWSFVSRALVAELLAKSVHAPGGLISPLQLCVIRASPDLRRNWPTAGAPGFDEIFKSWLRERGLDQFSLFWLCTRNQIAESVVARPSETTPNIPARYDILAPPTARASRSPDEPTWPPDVPPIHAPQRRTKSRLPYRSFGQAFPCLTVDCLEPSLIEDAAWSGLVRLAPDRSHVELIDSTTGLQLPSTWLPPSVLLLHLEIDPASRHALWLRILIDNHVIEARPAPAYQNGPLKIFLAERPPSPAPFLQFQFARTAGPAILHERIAVFARLHSIQFWQLG